MLTAGFSCYFKVEPFLQLSSGQSAHLYQLFVEKDDGLGIPWFQQILEQSFFHQDLKLRQLPSVFIVQMPRFGRQFKVTKNYSNTSDALIIAISAVS